MKPTGRQAYAPDSHALRGPESVYPRDRPIHSLFSEIAGKHPSATAIWRPSGVWSYGRLETAANRLARFLIAEGVKPEDRVGLQASRSPELIVALLAALKAGAAYLPLDPKYPARRRRFMIEDAAPRLILDERPHGDAAAKPPIFSLEAALRASAAFPDHAPPLAVDAQQLAYVMYTSGSTGRPKGVAVPHRGVVRLVRGADYARFGPEETILHASSISFDASVFEVWGALLNGGRLALAPAEDLDQLPELIRRAGVTTLWLTGQLFNVLVDEGPEAFQGTRQTLAGGEALSPRHVRAFLDQRPDARLINGYGPTEGTTFTCCCDLSRHGLVNDSAPIGGPIANTRAAILGQGMQPTPAGDEGELFIGGDGLARGYVNRPDLTAERFLPDPEPQRPGERLYRSGDWVRRAPNGLLEFRGRRDGQVKIRGFRVELGEIESALRRLPEVSDAAAAAKPIESGGLRIVAYVAPTKRGNQRDKGLWARSLKESLEAVLPDFMVPSRIVALEQLPTTAHGKLDRAALPEPNATDAPQERDSPRTETERVMANLWRSALDLEAVGVHDRFFDLGGDSIQAIRIVAEARRAGFDIKARDLLANATVAELAGHAPAPRRDPESWPSPERKAFALAGLAPEELAALRARFTDAEDAYPATPMQQGMLFHSAYEGDARVYRVQLSFRIEGPLRLPAFRQAWQYAIDRHPALRTVFWSDAVRSMQIPLRRRQPPWTILDCSDTPPQRRDAKRDELLEAEQARPFRLDERPPLRFALLQWSARERDFAITFHHALLDGWSVPILLEEISRAYQARLAGASPELAPVRPFRDYAAWLAGRDTAAAQAHWRARLADFRQPAILPEPPLRAANAHDMRVCRQTLDEADTEALNALARNARVTLNTLVQGAWALLLARYTGLRDVTFGVTVSGRPPELPGVTRMIGLFINTIPLRARIEPEYELGPWLRALQDRHIADREHETVALTEIQATSELASGEPLFQSVTVFENYPADASLQNGWAGLRFGEIHEREEANYPLVWQILPGTRLTVSLRYDAARVDDALVDRAPGHLVNCLLGFARRRRLGEVDALAARERAQLLAWSEGAERPRPEPLWHRHFEAWARRAPQRIAVAGERESLSYAALDQRAEATAVTLRSRGAGPETMVALFVERSAALVVGLLAIHKCGAAYAPLDPEYPRERLAHMLVDCQAPLALTTAALAPRLPTSSASPILIEPAPAARLARVETSPDQLAYVAYTSGSSGAPKGVAVSHRAIGNRLLWARDAYPLLPERRWLLLASFSFDISLWELAAPLMAGAQLNLAPPGAQRDPARLAVFMADRRVTDAHFTPSWLRAFLADPTAGPALSRLQRVFCGGEALTPELAQGFTRACRAELHHFYGPTEASINMTAWPCPRDPALVPLGRPIDNAMLYIVDGAGRLAPAGAPGELCIGGAPPARGYFNRPDLTAAAFTPDPFANGSRIYRTGDRAVWTANGLARFLGRIDRQLKIRGVRVEPGEIEATLCCHATVAEALVVARQIADDDIRLAAYVRPRKGATADPATLRAHLAKRLPPSMRPAHIAVLDRFPLDANGKIDRRALPNPEPGPDSRRGKERTLEPSSPTLEMLAHIWTEILGVRRAAPESDFFALGGHSLLATRVAARIRETFGAPFRVRALFDHPTLGALARHVDALLVEGRGDREPPVEPLPPGAPRPLSFAQERLWFLDRLESGSPHYNMPFLFRWDGLLDVPALLDAFGLIINRHETLRSRFPDREGQPRLAIDPPRPPPARCFDLTALSGDGSRLVLEPLLTALASQPFDLAKGPLLRLAIIRLAPDRWALAINLHHIAADAWSIGLLLDEWRTAYAALARRHAPRLPPLPIQYSDYAHWQRRVMSGDLLEKQLIFWRDRLAGVPPLAAPLDAPRPPLQTFNGRLTRFSIRGETHRAALALRERERVTVFMTMFAAFSAFLCRYAGQTDGCVGVAAANRGRPETESLIGLFVNTLALRIDLSGAPSFRQLLARVRRETLEAYAHRDAPFERIVERVRPERDLSRSPLFQVFFSLENAETAGAPIAMPGGSLRALDFDWRLAKFDLSLYIAQADDGLHCRFEYNSDLFERQTIERFAANFQTLTAGLLREPDRPALQTPMMTAGELRRVQHRWNESETEPPPTALALIAARTARAPDAIAAIGAGQSWSFRALLDRAGQLAARLRQHGAGPERPVAIAVSRTPHMVAAMLAAWQAGAAYTPLDPCFPRARLKAVLDDAGASVLLVDAETEPAMGWSGATRLRVDERLAPTDTPFETTVPRENLAYVIYTSGSTGAPKGVAITHGALANFLDGMARLFPLENGDRLLAVTTLSFDIAVLELLLPLTRGAATAIVGAPTAGEGDRLADALTRMRIGWLQATPATWRLLYAAGWRGNPSLAALCGGESLPGDLAKRLRRDCAALWNLYGPTETTVWSAFAPLDDDEVVIGGPIARTALYIVDRHCRLAPIGAPGELLIGGAGLARGYWGRPALTAAAFTPDPFGGRAGSRLYHTGDLARRRADGRLECLGRLDFQLKIRGFRIEPGEIEAVLRRHPLVSEAAVIAWDHGADRRLAAYVSPAPENAAEEGRLLDALRALAADRLPAYMRPAFVTALPQLPRTPNGKLDRRGLPAPQLRDMRHTAPRTGTERFLAAIWSEALHLPTVGVEANFFELGGHSLIAAQMIARAQARFPALSLRDLFQNPSLGALSQRADRLSPEPPPLPPVRPLPATAPKRMSFAQERLWFLEKLQNLGGAYNLPTARRLRGRLDAASLERALDNVLQRHETLRSRFPADAEAPVDIAEDRACLRYVDYSRVSAPEKTALARVAAEAVRPFELARQAPLRATAYRLAADDHVLLIVTHHLVSDTRSTEILLEELSQAYGDELAGRSTSQAKPLQYADFAAWQRNWMAGETLDARLAEWDRRLKGSTPLELPLDFPRPAITCYRGAREPVSIDTAAARGLAVLAREENATVFMALLAVYAAFLARWSGQRDFCIGAPVDNREGREWADVVGFFTNLLPLRFKLSGDLSFRELTRLARETAMAALERQHAPFAKIVEQAQTERDMSRAPLFQALLSLEDAPPKETAWPGARVSPQAFAYSVAKFDVSMDVTRDGAELSGSLEYRTELFAHATAARMTRCFSVLARALSDDPDRSIWRAAMLEEDERGRTLADWNQTKSAYPWEQPIHALFRACAAQGPNRTALWAQDQAISYADLDARSDRVAAALLARGVVRETRIGVCLPRSPALIAAVLGVLKAGGAYTPLDADDPPARLRFVVKDAAVAAVLSRPGHVPNEALSGTPLLDIDELSREATAVEPQVPADSGQLAYVMYTSGSTGAPKGVATTHRNVVRLVRGVAYARLGPDRILLHASSIAFDASTFEIWGALLHGAELVLAPPGEVAGLPALIRARAVDTVWLTGQLFNLLVDRDPESLASVEQVLAGGEALSVDHVRRFLAQGRGRLVNGYGPTETTTFACCCDLRHRGLTPFSAPIGGPIANARAYVLDARLEPCPVGVFGELFIGGDGLARGYQGHPGLTAESFVPDPYGDRAGERLYRSGDVVRWLPDGVLAFQGRRDAQVKIRGYRIEPAEIEAALVSHDAVSAAAVTTVDRRGERLLAAYVQANADEAVADRPQAADELAAVLRAHCAARLPAYMTPSFIVPMARLPVTRNGKLNRAALPEPWTNRSRQGPPPLRGLQGKLAEIWRETLGLDDIGQHDNFFDLGGNSLSIVKLHARLKDAGFDTPMVKLFEHPTLAALSAHLERGPAAKSGGDKLAARVQRRKKAMKRRR